MKTKSARVQGKVGKVFNYLLLILFVCVSDGIKQIKC